jgi:uncharacterized protein
LERQTGSPQWSFPNPSHGVGHPLRRRAFFVFIARPGWLGRNAAIRYDSAMRLDVLPITRPWYDDGLRFACAQCGNCCTGKPGYVWISVEEVERLAQHLHLPHEETVRRFCRNISGRLSLREVQRDGLYDCILLERVAGVDGQRTTVRRVCSIYPVRPLQCRTWPFWEGNLVSQESWDRARERCPGINRGPVRSVRHIEARRDAEDWPPEK